jgi:hypothetical protein
MASKTDKMLKICKRRIKLGLTDVDIGATMEDEELYSRSTPLRGFWAGCREKIWFGTALTVCSVSKQRRKKYESEECMRESFVCASGAVHGHRFAADERTCFGC